MCPTALLVQRVGWGSGNNLLPTLWHPGQGAAHVLGATQLPAPQPSSVPVLTLSDALKQGQKHTRKPWTRKS